MVTLIAIFSLVVYFLVHTNSLFSFVVITVLYVVYGQHENVHNYLVYIITTAANYAFCDV